MIHASELRIGNQVYYEGEIVEVDWNILGLVTTPYDPISVSDEILLKSGFLPEVGSFKLPVTQRTGENYFFVVRKVESVFVLGIDENEVPQVTLRSFHQLQNIYHSFTGQELPIDLTTLQ